MESFEIGISLALKDGVADGVAVARRDMQAVETALAAGAVSIQRLRDSAAVALGAAREGSAMHRNRGDADTRAPEEQPPASGPDLAVKATGAARQPQGPAVIDVAPSATLPEETSLPSSSERRSEAPPRSRIDSIARVPEPESAARPPSVTILQMASMPGAPGRIDDAVASPQPASRPDRVVQAFAPPQAAVANSSVAAVTNYLPAPPEQEGAHRTPAASFGRGLGVSTVSVQFPAEATGAAAAPAGRNNDSPLPPKRALSSSIPEPPRPDWKTTEPRFLSNTSAPPEAASQSDGAIPPAAAAAAPSGVSQEGGSGGGDVYLDGALLGRWISRHLAREAGRAPSGPTGFDMRRDPLLPGATVGM